MQFFKFKYVLKMNGALFYLRALKTFISVLETF